MVVVPFHVEARQLPMGDLGSFYFGLPPNWLWCNAAFGNPVEYITLAYFAARSEGNLINLQEELRHVVFGQTNDIQMSEDIFGTCGFPRLEHHCEAHSLSESLICNRDSGNALH
jgi:hypothetical protein